MDYVEIDGSYGEGGGQILRISLALSAITKKPVRIFNIRANRDPPGLRPQHLTVARSLRKICRGELKGDELGSREVVFYPGKIVGGKYELNIGTAGSLTLLFQAILPVLFFAEKKSYIRAIGGSHVKHSPTWEYFENVFLPALSHFGLKAKGKLLRPGYYPKGGGLVEVEVFPGKPKPLTPFSRSSEAFAVIRLSNLPRHIAIREKKVLVEGGVEMENVKIIEDKALSPGNAVTVWRGFVGNSSVGEKGKRAEEVAKEALEGVFDDVEVDYHLADQLLLYLALAGGSYSTNRFTQHLKSAAYVIKKFLDVEVLFRGNRVVVENAYVG